MVWRVQASLLLLAISVQSGISGAQPRLHVVTYSNAVDPRLSLTLGTADRHGISPIVLGYGFEATWAYGLSAMANLVRTYIFNRTAPEDVVLFVDAFDVMFQGSEDDIVSGYLELEKRSGRELFYHAEKRCSSDRKSDYPPVESAWRYLNCGVYIGRSRTLRETIYKDLLPNKLLTKQGKPARLQNWHTDYYLDHQDKCALDTGCALMQVVDNIDGLHSDSFYPEDKGLKVIDGQLHNTITGTVPLILHFPGSGHWPDWGHSERTGTCPAYEFFRSYGHPSLARLLEKETEKKKFFGTQPWKVFCSGQVTFWDQAAMSVSRFGDKVSWSANNFSGQQAVCLVSITVLVALLVLRRFRCLLPGCCSSSSPAGKVL